MDKERIAELEEQVAHLERALVSRDLIGQAKGILMVLLRISADEAFETLVEQSQGENRKLVDIAAEIVDRQQDRSQ